MVPNGEFERMMRPAWPMDPSRLLSLCKMDEKAYVCIYIQYLEYSKKCADQEKIMYENIIVCLKEYLDRLENPK